MEILVPFMNPLKLIFKTILTTIAFVYHLFKLFHTAFHKTDSHCNSGEGLSEKSFHHFFAFHIYHYGFPYSFMIVLIAKKMNISLQNKILLRFSVYWQRYQFNYRSSNYRKGPISPPADGNQYNFVILYAFRHFIVANRPPQLTSKYSIQTLLHLWIAKFGHPQYL